MHPLSTALLLLGYALAAPLAGRLPSIVRGQHRIAFAGHQAGMMLGLIGWLTRGGYTAAGIHAAWMIAVKIWFELAPRRHRRQPTPRGDLNG